MWEHHTLSLFNGIRGWWILACGIQRFCLTIMLALLGGTKME